MKKYLMIADTYIRKPWNIPKSWEKLSSKEQISTILHTLNQFEGSSYYVQDYFKERIIVDSGKSLILCGYSQELAEKEGLAFFKRIMDAEQHALLTHRDSELFKVFHHQPYEHRKALVHYYDTKVKNADGSESVLHHRGIPLRLDKNGNLWMALCSCSVSPVTADSYKALAINKETGQSYEFINGTYVIADVKPLTAEELRVLKWMIKDLTSEQISAILGIPEYTLKRIKRRIYSKFGVNTAGSAIHKAHLLGII